MSNERDLLAAAVERLEQLTAALTQAADADVAPEALKEMAEQALAVSSEVGERLPRVIREIEDAAAGSGPGAPAPQPGE